MWAGAGGALWGSGTRESFRAPRPGAGRLGHGCRAWPPHDVDMPDVDRSTPDLLLLF